MDALFEGALVAVFSFCDSPMTALALACTSKRCSLAMEQAWQGLTSVWAARWGLDEESQGRLFGSSGSGRRSKRLCDRDYYSKRSRFVRLVEAGAVHAAHIHTEIFNLSCEKRTLTVPKLRDILNHWTPVWVNCGGFGRERGSSSVLVEALRSRAVTARHAQGICEELVLRWGADIHGTHGDGMTPLAVASARGFVEVVADLVRKGASLTQRAHGTFMVKKRAIKGTMNPHEWAVAMYDAERAAGTSESMLTGIKKCVKLTEINRQSSACS